MKDNMLDLPTVYLQSASQIKSEPTGVHKLRLRNQQIQGELAELAAKHKSRITTHKHGDRIWFCVENLGIVVSLCQ